MSRLSCRVFSSGGGGGNSSGEANLTVTLSVARTVTQGARVTTALLLLRLGAYRKGGGDEARRRIVDAEHAHPDQWSKVILKGNDEATG